MFLLSNLVTITFYCLSLVFILWCQPSLPAPQNSLYRYSRLMGARKIKASLFRNILLLSFASLIWRYGGQWLLINGLAMEFLLLKNELSYLHLYKKLSKKILTLEILLFSVFATAFCFVQELPVSFYILLSALSLTASAFFNARLFGDKVLGEYSLLVKTHLLSEQSPHKIFSLGKNIDQINRKIEISISDSPDSHSRHPIRAA